MSLAQGQNRLSISDVSERTGIDQATLRAWETRYGFPQPERLENGRRSYDHEDVDLLHEVVRGRDAGMSLPASIERARDQRRKPVSIYAGVLDRWPAAISRPFPKQVLIELSHAIEDEYCARADDGVVFGSFQRKEHYRYDEHRWLEITQRAKTIAVFADFAEMLDEPGRPVEIPLTDDDPLAKEWSVVCDAPSFSACLLAWERPGQSRISDGDRIFDTVWSVEPELTRSAALTGYALASRIAPGVLGDPPPRFVEPVGTTSPEVRRLMALTNRMMSYASVGLEKASRTSSASRS